MSFRFVAFFAAILFCSLNSGAVVTLESTSGASGYDLSVSTKPVIYAGFAGSCTGDGYSTCDSCTGVANSGSKLWPCNKDNAYPNLKLNIRVKTSNTAMTVNNAFIKIGDSKYTPISTPSMADGILTTELYWSEICNHGNVGKGSQCDGGSFSVDLTIGFEISGTTSTVDSLTFRISARVAKSDNTDWTYTDCDTTASTGNEGFCHFEILRGDAKVYANDLVPATSYPTTDAVGVKYNNVAFFYEAQLAAETDAQTIARISNASSFYLLGVNQAANPPVVDSRISGLQNDTRYCFVMANQDASGVISYFTPLPGSLGSTVTTDMICTTPTKVVGLLDDKHCFVATAAFGSDMAPEVQILRDFRNHFLLSNKLGEHFVRFYYEHSPYYAKLISQSELARSVVRFALWPTIVFAKISLGLGVEMALLILLSMALVAFVVYRRMRAPKRGEV